MPQQLSQQSFIDVIAGANDRVYINDAATRGKVSGMIGSKAAPLVSKYGLQRSFPGASNKSRTINVQPTPEIASRLAELIATVESSVITPMWARRLESPIRDDGSLRIKLEATCPITLMLNGAVVGDGSLEDLHPGCLMAAYVELSHPWHMSRPDGTTIQGVSLKALAIIVETAPVATPVAAPFAW